MPRPRPASVGPSSPVGSSSIIPIILHSLPVATAPCRFPGMGLFPGMAPSIKVEPAPEQQQHQRHNNLGDDLPLSRRRLLGFSAPASIAGLKQSRSSPDLFGFVGEDRGGSSHHLAPPGKKQFEQHQQQGYDSPRRRRVQVTLQCDFHDGVRHPVDECSLIPDYNYRNSRCAYIDVEDPSGQPAGGQEKQWTVVVDLCSGVNFIIGDGKAIVDRYIRQTSSDDGTTSGKAVPAWNALEFLEELKKKNEELVRAGRTPVLVRSVCRDEPRLEYSLGERRAGTPGGYGRSRI